jgi:putative CocE/NonD family hydrolase
VAAIGQASPPFQDWLEHSTPGDPWWDPVDFGRRLDKVPPASLVGGWYDLFLPAQVADYEALRRAGRTARLTIGPWTHASPGLFAETVRDGPEWFDEQLGHRADREPRAPVRVYVMGSRTWQEFSLWPPAGEAQQWYLGRWGTLDTTAPAESAPDHFHFNPHDPTPAAGGPSLNIRTAGRKDQRRREHRHDVLTYTSRVLGEDLTVIGPLTATLYLRSSLEHTDFFVRLCDVSEKGRSVNLSDGIVRLAPGSVHKEDDGVFKLAVAMWPTANTFRAGHRIRLQVSSGAHPLFARNTGSGEPLATGATMRAADQEVFHDAGRPSCITLPVVRLLADEPL